MTRRLKSGVTAYKVKMRASTQGGITPTNVQPEEIPAWELLEYQHKTSDPTQVCVKWRGYKYVIFKDDWDSAEPGTESTDSN